MRLLKNPVTLASIFSSVAGAALMILASIQLGVSGFSAFSLVYLVIVLATGLARSGLFQPVLILRRSNPLASVPARYVLVVVLLLVPLTGLIYWGLNLLSTPESVVAGLLVVFPLVQDWLKHRHLAQGEPWLVAISEGIRIPVLALALLPISASVLGFVVLTAITYAVSITPLMFRLARARDWPPYSSYAHDSLAQAGDFAVAQLTTSVPLLLVGGISPGNPLVGGIRLAQTLFGPLNVLFSAASNNLLVVGARDHAASQDAALVRFGKKMATGLLGLAVMVTITLLALFSLTGWSPSGVEQASLMVGLVLVGLVAATSGWSGIHILVLRFFGKNQAILRGRIGVVAATALGYFAGYIAGGVDWSLICGFLALAASFPLVYGGLAYRSYRRL